jgi:hypothetical protein
VTWGRGSEPSTSSEQTFGFGTARLGLSNQDEWRSV